MNLDYYLGWLKTDFGSHKGWETLFHIFRITVYFTDSLMLQKCHHFLFSAHLLKIDSKMNWCSIQSLKSHRHFLNLFLENATFFTHTFINGGRTASCRTSRFGNLQKVASTNADLSTFPNFHCLVHWTSDYVRLCTVKIWKQTKSLSFFFNLISFFLPKEVAKCVWASNLLWHRLCWISQTLRDLSSEAVSRYFPPGCQEIPESKIR